MTQSPRNKWLKRIGIAILVPFGSIYVLAEILIQYIRERTCKEVNVSATKRTQDVAEDRD